MRYGVVQCYVDGEDCGIRFSPPFRFLSNCSGRCHILHLELTNTPGAKFREDRFEQPWPPEMPGFKGDIIIKKLK